MTGSPFLHSDLLSQLHIFSTQIQNYLCGGKNRVSCEREVGKAERFALLSLSISIPISSQKKKMVLEKSQQQISLLKKRFTSQPAQTLLVVKTENASPEDLSEVFQQ